MTQQTSPWLEGAYGWNFGEGGWNSGMDQNLLKFSFLFDRNVDSIVSSLPSAVNGQAHYLTTDNRLYFAVGTTYFSTPVPKWFTITLRGTGETHQFNGTSLVQVDSATQINTRLDAVELTISQLGTAAFEDIGFFASQSELDITEAQTAAYTDLLRSDLADLSPAKGSTLVGFIQEGAGAVGQTLRSKLKEVVSVKDFGAVGDGIADDTSAIQAAIDSSASGIEVFLPPGTYKTTATIFLKRSGVHLVGSGFSSTFIKFVNASGGVALSGHVDGSTSLVTISSCSMVNFTVLSEAAATDASKVLDITSFAYSLFDISAQTKRTNGVIFYGQGNNGSSPYYNRIKSPGLFGGDGAGGTNYTQKALHFAQGLWTGGSNGPNANIIGPIQRAAAIDMLVDIQAGNGNMFSNISGESINSVYFRLNSNPSVESGTSSGANGHLTLKDTSKAWTVNQFLNHGLQITSGTGAGQCRIVGNNTSTELTLREPWSIHPDATSQYSLYTGKASANKFVEVRAEGLSSLNPDFIQALPGTDRNEFSNCEVQSLGAGVYVRDDSGSPRNSWFAGSRAVMVHSISSPGNNANINIYARNSVFGGASFAGNYVLEWVKVALTSGAADIATINLDAGGTVTGNGSPNMKIIVPGGFTLGMAMPGSTDRSSQLGTNKGLFLNLQTGAAFGATSNVNITYAVTLV